MVKFYFLRLKLRCEIKRQCIFAIFIEDTRTDWHNLKTEQFNITYGCKFLKLMTYK